MGSSDREGGSRVGSSRGPRPVGIGAGAGIGAGGASVRFVAGTLADEAAPETELGAGAGCASRRAAGVVGAATESGDLAIRPSEDERGGGAVPGDRASPAGRALGRCVGTRGATDRAAAAGGGPPDGWGGRADDAAAADAGPGAVDGGPGTLDSDPGAVGRADEGGGIDASLVATSAAALNSSRARLSALLSDAVSAARRSHFSASARSPLAQSAVAVDSAHDTSSSSSACGDGISRA